MAKARGEAKAHHRRARRRACRPRVLGHGRDACRAAAGRAHLAAGAGRVGRCFVEGARRNPAAKAEDVRRPRQAGPRCGSGPDEWLVIDEAGKDPLADCAGVEALHSAVGISHRNVGISVTGPAAAAAVNAGCPQDLSLAAFPVGAASRTILGKVEIVLLRTGEDAFRVECWRSFADYVFTFLTEAAKDAAA